MTRYDPTVGVFASLDPFEGKTCTPMSLNGYSWVEGNVANWIDPTGNITVNSLGNLNGLNLLSKLNGIMCMSPAPNITQQPNLSGCVANSLNKNWYITNDLWNCSGSAYGYTCQEWLDEAHCILSEGISNISPGAAMNQAVRVLNEIQSRRLRIEFVQDDCCGAFRRRPSLNPFPMEAFITMQRLDLLPNITLSTHPEVQTLELITALVHESVHAGQRRSIIPNIRDEVEAYIVQWVVMEEMGLYLYNWERAFKNFVQGNTVTTSFDELCDARELIITCQSRVYDSFMIDLSTSAALCGYARKPVYDSLVNSGVVNPNGPPCS